MGCGTLERAGDMNDQVKQMAIAYGFHLFHLIRKEHFKMSLLSNSHFARFIFLMDFAFKVLNILSLYFFAFGTCSMNQAVVSDRASYNAHKKE